MHAYGSQKGRNDWDPTDIKLIPVVMKARARRVDLNDWTPPGPPQEIDDELEVMSAALSVDPDEDEEDEDEEDNEEE